MKTKIYIKKINKDIELPKIIDKGEWIDLRASGDYEIKRGDIGKIPLGVAIKIPKGYELNILPRSSTPLQFKVLLANSQGIGDYTFSGNKDEDIFSDFINTSSISKYYEDTFEKYNITHVILGKKSKTNLIINKSHDENYKEIYSDDNFVIYERLKEE